MRFAFPRASTFSGVSSVRLVALAVEMTTDTPSHASTSVAGSRRSPRTMSAPAAASPSGSVAGRTSARTDSPFASRSRTMVPPTAPVAPATSIIASSRGFDHEQQVRPSRTRAGPGYLPGPGRRRKSGRIRSSLRPRLAVRTRGRGARCDRHRPRAAVVAGGAWHNHATSYGAPAPGRWRYTLRSRHGGNETATRRRPFPRARGCYGFCCGLSPFLARIGLLRCRPDPDNLLEITTFSPDVP